MSQKLYVIEVLLLEYVYDCQPKLSIHYCKFRVLSQNKEIYAFMEKKINIPSQERHINHVTRKGANVNYLTSGR
jgi:hypothetical protein